MNDSTFNILTVCFYALQLLVLVGAAWYGYGQVREARRLRQQQFRPVVVVDLEEKNRILEIVVRNVGLTVAREVKFHVSPPFESSMSDYDLSSTHMFANGIATLPPGKEYRTLFDSLVQRSQSGLQRAYTVTVSYSDFEGEQTFTDESLLDIGIYHDFMYRSETDLKDVVKELKQIGKTMGKWTASLGGIKTLNPAEVREAAERYEKSVLDREESE